MAFTGRIGQILSQPGNIVPMFGAGGTKYAKAISGSLSFSAAISNVLNFIFAQLSLITFRAVSRSTQVWNAYSQLVMSAQPVGYWRLNDPNSVTMLDNSGYGNLGVGHGTITPLAAGPLNDSSNSMTFDGSSAYITANLVANIPNKGVAPWSAEALIYPNNLGLARGQVVLFNGSTTGWGFSIGTDSTADGKLYGLFRNVGWISTGYSFIVNHWYHVVMAYDGTTTFFYVNGTLVSSNTGSQPQVPAGSFVIANDSNPGSRYFSGGIQEVAIYPYALTAQQVLLHYNAFVAIPPAASKTILRTAV